MKARNAEGVAPWPVQLARYTLVGGAGTLAQYVILVVLVEAGWTGVVPASTLGAIAGALVNYVLNRGYTFASRKSHAHALPRFLIVAAMGIALNAIVLVLLSRHTGLAYLAAQVIATAVVLVAGFAANRRWSF